MIERLNHRLDVNKIQTLEDVRKIFDCINLVANVGEDRPDYEFLKEYFTIPYEATKVEFKLPRKSLEEIEKELDEKIDKQIEDVEYKFAQLKYYQEYQFSTKITQIIEDIEYARRNGSFPAKLDYSKLTATDGSNFTSSFVIKEGGKEVGYYTFGSGYLKYYMNKKPNFINRWFMKNCLSFRWVDV